MYIYTIPHSTQALALLGSLAFILVVHLSEVFNDYKDWRGDRVAYRICAKAAWIHIPLRLAFKRGGAAVWKVNIFIRVP